MRHPLRLSLIAGSLLLHATACSRSDIVTSHPADAPPRLLAPALQQGAVLSLYEGYDAIGIHEVHVDQGWQSQFVALDEPADDVAAFDANRWIVSHERSGRLAFVGRDGETPLAQLAPGPMRVATGDLNRDGRMDVVVLSDAERPILHLMHASADGFEPPLLVPLDPKGRQPATLRLVDLDQEGTLDVVTGLSTGAGRQTPVPDHLRIFMNTVHGGLVNESLVTVPSPSQVHAGDFDEDGLPDLLVTGSEGAWLLISAGYGWLEAPEKIARKPMADGRLWDVDGDGHLDIALLRANDATLDIRFGVGAGRSAPAHRVEVGAGPIAMLRVERAGQPLIVTANAEGRSFTTVSAVRTGSRRSGT